MAIRRLEKVRSSDGEQMHMSVCVCVGACAHVNVFFFMCVNQKRKIETPPPLLPQYESDKKTVYSKQMESLMSLRLIYSFPASPRVQN